MKCLKADNTRGSITVEAAIVMPLFVFFVLTITYLTGLYRVESIVGGALNESSMRIASNAYGVETISGDVAGKAVEGLIGTVSTQSILKSKVGEEFIDHSGIKNGMSGLICITDSFSNSDKITSNAAYVYDVPFNVFSLNSFVVKQSVTSRKWTGFDILEELTDEEIVYVTKNGTVYHRSPNCTHIKLDIRTVTSKDIGSLRNDSGNKYYPCSVCSKWKKENLDMYITGSGSCYHSSLNCSGLKRSVKAVSKSKVSGLSACQRCGG